MDTHCKNKAITRFIILVPHRDTVRILDEYRKKLFGIGFNGAYSFPSSAVLAEVSQPFGRDELKELATNIRRLTLKNDGKIQTTGPIALSFPISLTMEASFFGLPLAISPLKEEFQEIIPPTAAKKIINITFPPALCVALTNSSFNTKEKTNPPYTPTLSFRAAFVANLSLRPLRVPEDVLSFQWRIGTPTWLPSPARS